MKSQAETAREIHISQKIQKARKSGYSDQEITGFLSEKDPRISQAIEAGHDPKDVLSFISKRKISNIPEKIFGEKAINKFNETGGIIGKEIKRKPIAAIEGTIENPGDFFRAIPETAMKIIEGLGSSFNPPVQVPGEDYKDPFSGSNTIHKLVTKGLPEERSKAIEDISDMQSILAPIPGLGAAKGSTALTKAESKIGGGGFPPGRGSKPPSKFSQMIRERDAFEVGKGKGSEFVPDPFKSGLAKPGAVGNENASLGVISKKQKEQALDRYTKEAQELFKSKMAEKAPITEKIKNGFDFDKYHEEEFGRLRSAAKKANPQIDITPLSKFLSEETEKLRGILSPSPEKAKIKNILKKFRDKPVNSLNALLKNRSNNSGILTNIYDKRLMHGKQKEYVDFLNRMNKKIDESIFSTLPEDSKWVNQYKKMNAEFSQYKKGQDIIDALEPVLREKMSTSSLTSLAENPKKQKYLKIKMGDEAAEEIVQIAKDLKEAQRAIKRISVKDMNKFDAIWPISWAFKPIGALMTIKKGYDFSRKMYGYALLNPSKRKAFDQMLHAVADNNLPAYTEAAKKML